MKNKKYSIVYSSLTGNTKVLADAIHEALPQDECEYFGVSDTVIPSSELLYIGFWTDKGNADTKTLQLLSQLKNKQIFLFGTAGFGGSDIYFRKILSQVKQFIDASNVIRAISDKADDSAPVAYETFEEQAIVHTVKLLAAMFLKMSK